MKIVLDEKVSHKNLLDGSFGMPVHVEPCFKFVCEPRASAITKLCWIVIYPLTGIRSNCSAVSIKKIKLCSVSDLDVHTISTVGIELRVLFSSLQLFIVALYLKSFEERFRGCRNQSLEMQTES